MPRIAGPECAMKSTATTTEGVGPIKEQHVQVNISNHFHSHSYLQNRATSSKFWFRYGKYAINSWLRDPCR